MDIRRTGYSSSAPTSRKTKKASVATPCRRSPRPIDQETDFATYTHVSADASQVTFVNLASDSAALGEHFAVAGENPATLLMMAALEVTDVEIFGALTPGVEAMVAGMNPTLYIPDIGTSDRRLTNTATRA